jgi:NAD(P)-dependent dehydrogenase (short-subunit alcohol dehydrogenase family)
MQPIAGRTVLVTGAAKRIGRTIALRLAKEGARVAIHYNGSETEARATARECGNAPLFRANLASVPEIERMFTQIDAQLGGLDALVNNAARYATIDALDITEADWDSIHSINLKATFFCTQQAARRMINGRGGRIVNMSSLGGLKAWPDHAHYCASKAGVIMLTKALAQAFAPQVTVNSVAPGVIPFGEHDPLITRLVSKTPANRAGTGEDIADAVLYFLTCSDFITGQIVAVDGGLSLR